MSRCPETTKKGKPCPWEAEFSDGRCKFHSQSPEGKEALVGMQRRAAESSKKSRAERVDKARTLLALDIKLDTETDIKRVLEQVAQQVAARTMRADAAQAIARLCSTAMAIIDGKSRRDLEELKKQMVAQGQAGRKGLRAV